MNELESLQLPYEWALEKGGCGTFRKTFPDGTDVSLTIQSRDGLYEVVSSVEHRLLNPSEVTLFQNASLGSVIQFAIKEIDKWEERMERPKRMDFSNLKIKE
jgi:hypothetical protein